MGFVVLPAVVNDISAVYDAYFAAFKTSPVTRAFFPSVTEEDLTNPESEFRYALCSLGPLRDAIELAGMTLIIMKERAHCTCVPVLERKPDTIYSKMRG